MPGSSWALLRRLGAATNNATREAVPEQAGRSERAIRSLLLFCSRTSTHDDAPYCYASM
jgi:hypothetical protein